MFVIINSDKTGVNKKHKISPSPPMSHQRLMVNLVVVFSEKTFFQFDGIHSFIYSFMIVVCLFVCFAPVSAERSAGELCEMQ